MAPSSTRTMEGGMICPRVPEAQIVPHAILGSYPALSIEGSDSSPMVTTVAPTMPVDAASSMPTMTTERPRPPRSLPNSKPIVSSSCSAILEIGRAPVCTPVTTAHIVCRHLLEKTKQQTHIHTYNTN